METCEVLPLPNQLFPHPSIFGGNVFLTARKNCRLRPPQNLKKIEKVMTKITKKSWFSGVHQIAHYKGGKPYVRIPYKLQNQWKTMKNRSETLPPSPLTFSPPLHFFWKRVVILTARKIMQVKTPRKFRNHKNIFQKWLKNCCFPKFAMSAPKGGSICR